MSHCSETRKSVMKTTFHVPRTLWPSIEFTMSRKKSSLTCLVASWTCNYYSVFEHDCFVHWLFLFGVLSKFWQSKDIGNQRFVEIIYCIKPANIARKVKDAFKHRQHLITICVPKSVSASPSCIAWSNLRRPVWPQTLFYLVLHWYLQATGTVPGFCWLRHTACLCSLAYFFWKQMNKKDFSLNNLFVGKVGSLKAMKEWYCFVRKIGLHTAVVAVSNHFLLCVHFLILVFETFLVKIKLL